MKTYHSTLLDGNPALPSASELRALFNGRVIAPDDPRYESARTVVYGGIDRRPAAIKISLRREQVTNKNVAATFT